LCLDEQPNQGYAVHYKYFYGQNFVMQIFAKQSLSVFPNLFSQSVILIWHMLLILKNKSKIEQWCQSGLQKYSCLLTTGKLRPVASTKMCIWMMLLVCWWMYFKWLVDLNCISVALVPTVAIIFTNLAILIY
jgi:hypothetical protein